MPELCLDACDLVEDGICVSPPAGVRRRVPRVSKHDGHVEVNTVKLSGFLLLRLLLLYIMFA